MIDPVAANPAWTAGDMLAAERTKGDPQRAQLKAFRPCMETDGSGRIK
jgi:hypothetical protein